MTNMSMMGKMKTSVMKGVAVGLFLGSMIGVMTACAIKPKRSKFSRCAGRALDAVGTMMQNISDWAF